VSLMQYAIVIAGVALAVVAAYFGYQELRKEKPQ